jgi:hypothetical protein
MRQVGSIGMRDQLVINHRQPVAEGFEPLPHRDLLRSVKLIKRARFDGGDQAVKGGVEGVEGQIYRRALVAPSCGLVLEFHTSIIIKTVFYGTPIFQ